MLRRILTVIGLLIITSAPAAVLADTSVQHGASATELGPSTTGAVGTGGSSADSGTLQPAGSNPLQSSTNAATGLTAPDSSVLQAPASDSGTLQVIEDQADGSPHQLGESSRGWLWWLTGLLAVVIIVVLLAALHRRRRPQPAPADIPAAEPIRDLKLTVTIHRPAADIFDYLLDPANTPKWISDVASQEADELPPKLGTQYKNQDPDGVWTEYEIIGLEPPHHFTCAEVGGPRRVKYTFTPAETDTATELEYHEWVENGELQHPFPPEALQKLKELLEAES